MSWWTNIFNPPYIRSIEEGTNIILKRFQFFPKVEESLEIQVSLTLRIVGNNSQFSNQWARDTVGVFGYAEPNRIEIHGAMKDGQVIFEPSCLGHEFWHTLAMADSRVMNPDDLQKDK